MESCGFSYIFKNDSTVVHVWTVASDILGYPYVEKSSARSTLKKCTVFFNILVFIHFKLILEYCTSSGMYLEQYQTSMMNLLAALFSQKRSIIDIWQGSKYRSAASLLNIFPLSLFGYLNEYMNILFFFWKWAATLPMWRKLKILYNISFVPKLFALNWPWKFQMFIYLYDTEVKQLTFKNVKMECKADIYY